MKKVVSYDRQGARVATFRSVKDAAADLRLTLYYLKLAIAERTTVKDVRLMYADDYAKALADGVDLSWGRVKKPKTKQERREQKATSEYALRNRLQTFKEWARPLLDWLRGLGKAYRERGDFPIFPTMIADYYTDVKDKEIALFSALLMSENEKTYEQVQDMRRIITDEPFAWFLERGFVTLSTGDMQGKMLEGNAFVKYWKIARLFDWLFEDFLARGRFDIESINGVCGLEELHISEYNKRLVLLAAAGKI